MGDHRRNLLESASFDMAVAAKIANETGNLSTYRSVESLLDAFEYTLEAGSEAKKEVLRAKDDVETEKREKKQRYQQDRDRLGFFERQDIERTMEREIEIESVGKRLQSCWEIATKRGLFND